MNLFHRSDKSFSPLWLTLIYVIFASLLAFLIELNSDNLLGDWLNPPFFNSVDEVLFVVLTAIILYGLLRLQKSQQGEIRRLARERRKEEELLRRTFDSMKSAILLIDTQERVIIDCNKSAQRIFGYDREELIGSPTRMLHVSDEKFREFDEIGEQALEEEGIFQTEFRMQRKEGTVFFTDHTVTLVYDTNGEVDCAVSVVRDITDQKQQEQKLRKRQERLERSQRISLLGDWEYIPETESLSWSPMMYEIFERDPEKAPPSYDELADMYGDDEDKHLRYVRRAIEEGKPFDIDLHLQTESDSEKYIRAIGLPQTGDNGKVQKLLGVVQDITKRKEMEHSLSESRQRLKAVTDNVPGVVFRYQLSAEESEDLFYVSEGVEEVMGFTAEQVTEDLDKVWDRIHSLDIKKVQQSIKESADNMTKWDQEWRFHHPDGTVRWQHGVGIPHQQDNGNIVWDSIIVDITDQKEIREQLIQSVLEGEDRERRRIAGELHDGIAQYLTAAHMNLEAVNANVQKLSGKSQQRLTKARELLQQAITETRNMSHNLMPRILQDYGLITAVEEMFDSYQDTKGIEFQFDHRINENLFPPQIQLNIYRIIQECVSNSIKYANCSVIQLQIYQEEQSIYLTIEDDGKGFEPEELQQIEGFGLKSIRSRVRAMSGSIDFDSTSGNGMVVSLDIPLETNQEIT